MRIDASNLIAAQATPVQRSKPPVHKAPEPAKPDFEPITFSKAAKDAAGETLAQPEGTPKPQASTSAEQNQTSPASGGQHQRQGSYLDITV